LATRTAAKFRWLKIGFDSPVVDPLSPQNLLIYISIDISAADDHADLLASKPFRTFEYRSTDFTQPNYVTVAGSFQSDGTASGVIGLGQYNGCGDGGGSWTARR